MASSAIYGQFGAKGGRGLVRETTLNLHARKIKLSERQNKK